MVDAENLLNLMNPVDNNNKLTTVNLTSS